VFKRRTNTQAYDPTRFVPPLGRQLDGLAPGRSDASEPSAWSTVEHMLRPEEICGGWFDVALHDNGGKQLGVGRIFYTDRAVLLDAEYRKPRRQPSPERIEHHQMSVFGQIDGRFCLGFTRAHDKRTIMILKFLNPADAVLLDRLSTVADRLHQKVPGVFRFDPDVVSLPV
jgi:hypothetical protein